jgi:hypothetical protein
MKACWFIQEVLTETPQSLISLSKTYNSPFKKNELRSGEMFSLTYVTGHFWVGEAELHTPD